MLYSSRPPDSFITGTLVITTTATNINTSPQHEEVCIQIDPDSVPDVFVGNSIVQTIQLQPGQSMNFNTNNIAGVYFVTASSTAVVNYLIRRVN